MIPSLFFAERKHPKNPNLKMEEEACLHQIFYELHGELEEIKSKRGKKSSYDYKPSLRSQDLNKALPSGFFDQYDMPLYDEDFESTKIAAKKKVGRPKKEVHVNLPSTGCKDLDEMYKDVFEKKLPLSENRELMARLVSKLNAAGFKVDGCSDKQVRDAFRMLIEETIERIKNRPASLNCYDYVRLKDEIKKLADFPEVDIHKDCPTIMGLIKEVEDAEAGYGDYPIRPFPFDKVKDRSSWPYQSLRILDEILYTAKYPLNTIQIQSEIRAKCDEYGISYKTVSVDSLKKQFSTLRSMINVEYTGGFRKAYQRDVYVRAMHGHKYDLMRGGDQPVTAFKLCYSRSEAIKIQSEINKVLDRLIDEGLVPHRNEFAEEYPLLATMAQIESYDPALKERSPKLMSYDGKQNSSIYILNYLPPVKPTIKRKVEQALKAEPVKIISIEKGEKQGKYLPIILKEQGLDWALLARDVETGLLHQIAPSDFGSQFSLEDSDPVHFFKEPGEDLNGMIGLGDLYFGRKRYRITIGLTKKGYEILQGDSHPLYPLIKNIFSTDEKNNPCEGVAEFDVFVNDDFLEEIYRLDRKRQIVDLYSKEVAIKDEYLRFLKRKGYDTKISAFKRVE